MADKTITAALGTIFYRARAENEAGITYSNIAKISAFRSDPIKKKDYIGLNILEHYIFPDGIGPSSFSDPITIETPKGSKTAIKRIGMEMYNSYSVVATDESSLNDYEKKRIPNYIRRDQLDKLLIMLPNQPYFKIARDNPNNIPTHLIIDEDVTYADFQIYLSTIKNGTIISEDLSYSDIIGNYVVGFVFDEPITSFL